MRKTLIHCLNTCKFWGIEIPHVSKLRIFQMKYVCDLGWPDGALAGKDVNLVGRKKIDVNLVGRIIFGLKI